VFYNRTHCLGSQVNCNTCINNMSCILESSEMVSLFFSYRLYQPQLLSFKNQNEITVEKVLSVIISSQFGISRHLKK
jgi:hypothetical protein